MLKICTPRPIHFEVVVKMGNKEIMMWPVACKDGRGLTPLFGKHLTIRVIAAVKREKDYSVRIHGKVIAQH